MRDRPVAPEPRRHAAEGLLVLIVCLDGAGVLGVILAAVVTSWPALWALAAIGGGTWALAVAAVRRVIRVDTPAATGFAVNLVTAGLAINTIGAIVVLVVAPPVAGTATALLAGGVVVSLGYLVLLGRLNQSRRKGAPL